MSHWQPKIDDTGKNPSINISVNCRVFYVSDQSNSWPGYKKNQKLTKIILRFCKIILQISIKVCRIPHGRARNKLQYQYDGDSRSNQLVSAASLLPVAAPGHLVEVGDVTGQHFVHGLDCRHGSLAVTVSLLLDGVFLGHCLQSRTFTQCRVSQQGFQPSLNGIYFNLVLVQYFLQNWLSLKERFPIWLWLVRENVVLMADSPCSSRIKCTFYRGEITVCATRRYVL